MELPVTSNTLASELPDAARRGIGPSAIAGADASFRAHLESEPPAAKSEPARTADAPPREVPPPADEDPASSDEPSAAPERDAPAAATVEAAAPAAPSAVDAGAGASQAEPAAPADSSTPHPADAASSSSPTPTRPTSSRARLAPEAPHAAPRATAGDASPDRQTGPAAADANPSSAVPGGVAVTPAVTASAPVAADGPAPASDRPARRGSTSRGEGRQRATGGARGEGTATGESRGDAVARGAPRTAPASATAVSPNNEGPAPTLAGDPVLPETAPSTGAPDDPAARPPGLPDRLAHHLTTRTETSPGSTVPISAADQQRLVQRVARAIEAAAHRGGVLRLRLRPPELGSLRLEVTLQPGKLAARIETETSQARTILLDNLPQLRARLAEQGMIVERFDVDVSAHDNDPPSSGAQDWEAPGSSTPAARRSQRTSSTPSEPPARAAYVSPTPPGTLNVVI